MLFDLRKGYIIRTFLRFDMSNVQTVIIGLFKNPDYHLKRGLSFKTAPPERCCIFMIKDV